MLRLPDGTAIFTREWAVAGGVPRGSVLIVHGLGEHSGRYEHVAERLTAIGLTVHGYDLRGHGRSEGPRGSLPGDDALLEDLSFVFGRIAARADRARPQPRRHAGGARDGRRLDRAARARPLLAGASRCTSTACGWARSAWRAGRYPTARCRACSPSKLSHDPAEVAAYKADALVHNRITPRMFWFLHEAGEAVRRDAAKLTVPTLLLASGIDGIVDPAGSRELAAALPASATAHIYDDLHHELFNEREPDRTRVLDDLIGWLEQQL